MASSDEDERVVDDGKGNDSDGSSEEIDTDDYEVVKILKRKDKPAAGKRKFKVSRGRARGGEGKGSVLTTLASGPASRQSYYKVQWKPSWVLEGQLDGAKEMKKAFDAQWVKEGGNSAKKRKLSSVGGRGEG